MDLCILVAGFIPCGVARESLANNDVPLILREVAGIRLALLPPGRGGRPLVRLHTGHQAPEPWNSGHFRSLASFHIRRPGVRYCGVRLMLCPSGSALVPRQLAVPRFSNATVLALVGSGHGVLSSDEGGPACAHWKFLGVGIGRITCACSARGWRAGRLERRPDKGHRMPLGRRARQILRKFEVRLTPVENRRPGWRPRHS
jgi:hypothetical protein